MTDEQIRSVIRRLDQKALLYAEDAKVTRGQYNTQHAAAEGRWRAYVDAAEYLRAYVPTPRRWK